MRGAGAEISVWRRFARLAGAIVAVLAALPCQGGVTRTWVDAPDDDAPRRTDAGANGSYNPNAHRPIDLRAMTIGRWTPADPATDRFIGAFTPEGAFFRLDVELAGVINPPGPTSPSGFAPFIYGPNPVYGFIELDVDHDNDTGGELFAPEYRYLANVGRFGGLPVGDEFEYRAARQGQDIDGSFFTMPWVERSGEEFHLALLAEMVAAGTITKQVGDEDDSFEAGETWDIAGPWLHRAHGYEPYSLAHGGSVAGEYMPECVLRFRHDPLADVTVLSLVFPLTNAGAAALLSQAPEANNFDSSDQASVLEALEDLVLSAEIVFEFGSGEPEEVLILPWRLEDAYDHLSPTEWRATALLGTSYAAPEPAGAEFIWTDVFPDVVRGDVNREHGATEDDYEQIAEFIEDHDDDDGQHDESATIFGFGPDFAVHDLNQDGRVDAIDLLLVRKVGDLDGDDDVDLIDLCRFQGAFDAASSYAQTDWVLSDLNADGVVDLADWRRLRHLLSGPRGD
jgi:hypothetical protein